MPEQLKQNMAEGGPKSLDALVNRTNDYLRNDLYPELQKMQKEAADFITGFSEKMDQKVKLGEKLTEADLKELNDFTEKIDGSVRRKFDETLDKAGDNFLLKTLLGMVYHDKVVHLFNKYMYYGTQWYTHVQQGGEPPVFKSSEMQMAFTDLEVKAEDLIPVPEDARTLIKYNSRPHMDFKEGKLIEVNVENDLPSGPVLIKSYRMFSLNALAELRQNALDAMPQGGAIKWQVEKTGDNAAIIISDTGQGIGAENLAKIFKVGFTTKPKGTGRGLPLAKEYFEDILGGKMEVTSELGRGTTIKITLPLFKMKEA